MEYGEFRDKATSQIHALTLRPNHGHQQLRAPSDLALSTPSPPTIDTAFRAIQSEQNHCASYQ